jgi:hypothetical protein
MSQLPETPLTSFTRNTGCSCKIAPQVLEQIIKPGSAMDVFPQLLVGNESLDDAAVLDLGNGSGLIATTDFFTPIVDEPFVYGKIAAANAISDVYAIGGKPILALAILRRTTRLDRPTLCALAATYGSVSVVTFAAGQQHLETLGLTPGGYMAAVLALMETPAILTALILLNGAGRGEPGRRRAILREVFVGAASVMLLGSFLVGALSGEAGLARLDVFVGPLFQGALCFFLLDIGLTAARRLMEGGRKLSAGVIAFALGFPLLSAALALAVSRLAGLEVGDAALLTILAASASYIAVPAAMRLAAPKADPGVFVTASLAVTFPFNLSLGLPLYYFAASNLLG